MPTEDDLAIEFSTAIITQLSFGWGLSMIAEGGEGSERADIQIEGTFRFERNGETPAEFEPGEWLDSRAADLLSLIHRRLVSAEVSAGGGLKLYFDAGVSVTVYPGKEFEAWQFHSPSLNAYGLSGGEVGFSER
jgi:Family of unknown function (DUF6188)